MIPLGEVDRNVPISDNFFGLQLKKRQIKLEI